MNDKTVRLQQIDQPQSAAAVLRRKLAETNRKLAVVLRQKDNLSETCRSRGEYIEQLTSRVESLQSQNAVYETTIQDSGGQYRQACEQIDWLTVQTEEADRMQNRLEQDKESLQARLADANGQIEILTNRLAGQADSLKQAHQTIQQLNRADGDRPCPGRDQGRGIDAAVQQAQEAIGQLRRGFSFGLPAQHTGQNSVGDEDAPESAGQANKAPGGKTRSLQYQLNILGGPGPERI